MKVKIEDGGACRKVLHVEAAATEVAGEYENVVKEFVRFGKVPGFRPGKAPAPVVERHYTKTISEETRDRLVPRFYREALKENQIEPVSIVDVRDVKFGKEQGLTFQVTVDVAPDFKLPKYKKFTVKENAVKVDEKDVDKEFQRLLDSFARFEDAAPGHKVGDGDLVKIDYRGTIDGKAVGTLAADCQGIGEAKDFWVLQGEREFLPGFAKGLEGAAAEEKREIGVTFPADYHVKEVAGKSATYSVLVKGMRRKVPPEVNAEFLKQFDVETREALLARVREQMQARAEQQEKERQRDEISKWLLKETDFDLPMSVVEQETNLAVRNMVQRFVRQGATREQLAEHRDDIMNAASQSSKDRVKMSYILSRIATEEKIEVQDAEVDKRMEDLAKHYDMPVDRFREELEKRNGVEGLRSDIRAEKTMDMLLANATKK